MGGKGGRWIYVYPVFVPSHPPIYPNNKQPTTVNMCIVLSGAAGANLALAVFNAVLSNFLGVFIAPATIIACIGGKSINVPYLSVIEKLVSKVLVPVFLGVTLRAQVPSLRQWLGKPASKLPMKLMTESILIAVIYTTFCQSFLEGLKVTGRDLIGVALAVPLFHIVSLFLMLSLARVVTDKKDEQITAMFVGSHKTLAFGMPLMRVRLLPPTHPPTHPLNPSTLELSSSSHPPPPRPSSSTLLPLPCILLLFSSSHPPTHLLTQSRPSSSTLLLSLYILPPFSSSTLPSC